MIEFPHSLQEHFSNTTTTLCYVWIVERNDGIKLGFTDHDKEIELLDVLCQPTSGFTASAIEASLGFSGDTNQVEGALSSDAISETDIASGHYDDARILQYLVNWKDVSSYQQLRKYYVGEITKEDNAFRVELRSFSAQLDQAQGRHYLRRCDAELGDTRCGVNLEHQDYRASGSVVTNADISSQTIVTSVSSDFPKTWFAGGMIHWKSGQLTGKKFEIAETQKHTVTGHTTIRLVRALPLIPQVGDSFTLTAGCDKSFQSCKNKFANRVNFRGFPHMPSNDAALTYVSSEGDFDGDPLVP